METRQRGFCISMNPLCSELTQSVKHAQRQYLTELAASRRLLEIHPGSLGLHRHVTRARRASLRAAPAGGLRQCLGGLGLLFSPNLSRWPSRSGTWRESRVNPSSTQGGPQALAPSCNTMTSTFHTTRQLRRPLRGTATQLFLTSNTI